NTGQETREMLAAIGVSSIQDLFTSLPLGVVMKGKLRLPQALSEPEVVGLMESIAAENKTVPGRLSFLGGGAAEHFIPSAVDHITGRGDFYTAYTPYQAEASQGTLQAIFEYQTLVCELTGLDVSNASHYDGATAMAEAALMALDLAPLASQDVEKKTGPATKSPPRSRVVVCGGVNPEYLAVLKTYLRYSGCTIELAPAVDGATNHGELAKRLGDDVACVIAQSPNFYGCLEEMTEIGRAAHAVRALFVAVCEPISLALLEAPGNCGADIAVGDGQSLGNEVAFGGPSFGFQAARMEFVRRLPGRIVGETVDVNGRRAFVLTLQTREQHIRREKATSNICSNEALCALRSTVYMSLLGKRGLAGVADLCVQKAHYAADRIAALSGFKIAFNRPFFNEFVVSCPAPAAVINERLRAKGIVGGLDLAAHLPGVKNPMLLAVTELHTKADLDRLVSGLSQ
ncbi:MAG: aminomethyl-transferring glycine dehydrogenase subunit GcvPA, partial [Planctomycetota bacterium]|nr:aminomethyl-transferring glycine dehydrogenase subunit GcvPA [Planctomycetota bacterium]